MRIVMSSGHGLKIRGARGNPVPPQVDEVNEARHIVNRTAEILEEIGVKCTTLHDDQSTTQDANLKWLVDHHNQLERDVDISVHLNAYDHSAHGTEVLYISSTGHEIATKVCNAICAAVGYTNRGAKQRNDLYFLAHTEMPAALIETFFCDHTGDCQTYRDPAKFEKICRAIAESLAGHAVTQPPEIEPPVPPLHQDQEAAIVAIASASSIAKYHWKDRGLAPPGYIQGFALSWAQVVRKYMLDDPAVLEMAKADTGNDDKDVLAWYQGIFMANGMDNNVSGLNTLRHLFALLLGLGMRESSGKHCEGRDTSASNVTSDTAEAGLYQTSYNAHSSTARFDEVMADYENGLYKGYLDYFRKGVSCSSSSWASYGSGVGREFQDMCKEEPAFAVETCALVLRNLRQHYGPINRKEAELRHEADDMLHAIQHLVEDVA